MSDLLTQVTEASRNMLPLGKWVNAGVRHLLDHGAKVFDSIGVVVEGLPNPSSMACWPSRSGW